MASKRTNKLSIPVIMTVTGDRVLQSTGSLVGATTALGIANGNIGLISWDYNGSEPLGDFLQAGDCTVANTSAIKIVRGTPASANTTQADIWEVGDKAYLESGIIRPEYVRSVTTKVGRFAQWGASTITGFSTPQDNTEYKVYARLLSVSNDKIYGDNDNVLHASVPATDFTALGTVDSLDYVLQNLGDQLNRYGKYTALNSTHRKGNQNILVLGINSAGGGGDVLNAIAEGDTISFIEIDGVTSTFVADKAFIQALAQACVDASIDWDVATLEVINSVTPGSAATIDTLIAFGLPRTTAAYFDNVEQVQTRIELNVGSGFQSDSTVVTPVHSSPNEGTGQGSKWVIASADRYLTTVHTKQVKPFGEFFATGKDYVDATKLYTSVIVDYYDTEETLSTTVKSPKQLIILFTCEADSAFTVDVQSVGDNLVAGDAPIDVHTVSSDAGTGTVATNVATSFESLFTAWFENARSIFNFELHGDAVAGNYLP